MDQLRIVGNRLYGMRRKLATWGLFLFAAYLAVHVVFGANGWMVYEKKKAEYRQVSADVERMKQENDRLAQQIKSLQTDKKTIEMEARTQMGYAKPGEIVIVIPTPAPKPDITSTAQNKDSKK
jgi:cell division protein FtsB